MTDRLQRIKPGWYLLGALTVYAIATTILLQRTNAEVRDLRIDESTAVREAVLQPPAAAAAPEGLWFPLPGASLPADDEHLPNADRPYRSGVSQGFAFWDGDVGVPVPYGAPVIAAAGGTVERADAVYAEMTPDTFLALLDAVEADGASAAQLDLLRGRQVWIRASDGRLLRYAHLSGVRPGLAEDQEVFRGQVIGYVGNSGTDAGVAGTRDQARLHFEIWDGATFFGDDLSPDEVRMAAASLFTGP